MEVLKDLPSESIDSVVTDPPYGLSQISTKQFNECMIKWCTDDRSYMPKSKGFMGKSWDSFVPPPSLWDEVYRVLKPGGHALVFAGSRTQDLMGLSLRLAGFEMRDVIQWIYSTGFPKSLNIGNKWEAWKGWGTALKPAYEPALLVRKAVKNSITQNVSDYGVGAINIDGCRIGKEIMQTRSTVNKNRLVTVIKEREGYQASPSIGRFPTNILLHENIEHIHWNRFFYSVKASTEEREEGLEAFKKVKGGSYEFRQDGSLDGKIPNGRANIHPTVKPIDLMRYLCRLITPPNGTILEPFMGSGSTGIGAVKEGFNFIGIEREEEYFEIAKARIEYWSNIDLTYDSNEEKIKDEQLNIFG